MDCVDVASESLLPCEEDNSSLLEFEGKKRAGGGQMMLLRGLLPVQSEDCLSVMIEKEKDYVVGADYVMKLKNGDLDLNERRTAVDWITKANVQFGFGPLCAYLAISFVDRFMSAFKLPKGKGWAGQLLAIACLSIATKMEETVIPFTMTLQVCGSKFIFEAKVIQRMELLVLSTLQWRMQAVTPFAFFDSFLHMIHGGKDSSPTLFRKAVKLISSTNKGIELLEFRPSEIAGAVALSLSKGDKSLSLISHYVEKERVVNCLKMMKEIGLISRESAFALCSDSAADISLSPNAVLDRALSMTNRSDETQTTFTCFNSNKRRKLNMPLEMDP